MFRALPAIAPRVVTPQLCQAAGADSTHARCTSLARYTGMLAPSHIRAARSANRLSGGVVITTYAAAAPAEINNACEIVRAVCVVTRAQLRDPPKPPLPDWVPPGRDVESAPLGYDPAGLGPVDPDPADPDPDCPDPIELGPLVPLLEALAIRSVMSLEAPVASWT